MSEKIVYVGRDLEAMSFAVNYHRWILDAFSPSLGARLVEVGAGNGRVSELFWRARPETISLVEPSTDMHRLLEARVTPRAQQCERRHLQTPPRRRSRAHPRGAASDSVIYVNVLEHVADASGVRAVERTLGAGGRIFSSCPRCRGCMGSSTGGSATHRRYTEGRA